jgi:hypothetical protein
MNNIENQPVVNRCDICPIPREYAPKPIFNHRYGDYVVLRPNEKSCQKLQKLAHKITGLIGNELMLPPEDFFTSDKSSMHLTLAMPLAPLSRSMVTELLSQIKDHAGNGPILFDLIFRGPNSGGSCNFAFGAPNFAPGFDIRLRKPSKSWYDHNSEAAHQKITNLAGKIQEFCESQNLVDSKKNINGKCNKFNPHISLGKMRGSESCKALHDRQAHRSLAQTALNHLASKGVEASKEFECGKAGHDNCTRLSLCFDKVEILRVDALENISMNHILAKLDLTTNEAVIGKSLPGCRHRNNEAAI